MFFSITYKFPARYHRSFKFPRHPFLALPTLFSHWAAMRSPSPSTIIGYFQKVCRTLTATVRLSTGKLSIACSTWNLFIIPNLVTCLFIHETSKMTSANGLFKIPQNVPNAYYDEVKETLNAMEEHIEGRGPHQYVFLFSFKFLPKEFCIFLDLQFEKNSKTSFFVDYPCFLITLIISFVYFRKFGKIAVYRSSAFPRWLRSLRLRSLRKNTNQTQSTNKPKISKNFLRLAFKERHTAI